MRSPNLTRSLVLFLVLAAVITVLIRFPMWQVHAGNTITVNSTSDVANSSDGLCTLREAITAANTNTASGGPAGECVAGSSTGADVIDATGVSGTINLTGVLPNITSSMTITGPGSTQLTVRRNMGGDYRIFTISSSVTVAISGMTITNGKTPDGASGNSGSSAPDGGGLLNAGTLTLTDFVSSGNRTGNGGTGSTFSGGNGGNGGGVANVSNLTMTNCAVTGNTTGNGGNGLGNGGHGGNGGGIFSSGPLTLSNCTITGNQGGNNLISGGFGGGGHGGGVYSTSGPNNFINVTVSNNVSGNSVGSSEAGIGGGIYFDNGGGAISIITNSTVDSNRTGTGGGLGYGGGLSGYGAITIIGSTISNNVSSGSGGGLLFQSGSLRVFNTTVSGNSGPGGAGMGFSTNSPVYLVNCTITGNTGSPALTSNGPPNVRNTIVAANSSDLAGSFNSQGHNLIGNPTGGSGFTNGVNGDQVGTSGSPLNPQLGPLANNGGPTQTHALLPGGPALNAGDNCVTDAAHCGEANITQLTTDERGTGFNRLVGSNVDIGAFESRGFTITATGGTPQSATITSTFSTPLSATVSSAFGEPVANGVITFTAPVSGQSGTFTGGVTTMTATANSSGVATSSTFTANSLAGSYSVNAGANGITGTASFSLTNSPAATTTGVSSSINPSNLGQSVTFTATVSSGAGTPTGSVQFKDGGASLGSPVALGGGVAQLTTSALTAGSHTITADYSSGDANFTGSSGTLSGGQSVLPALSINDVSATEGDSGTKTFTFTVALSGASNQTVTVNFATSDGSANAPSDYVGRSGETLTFVAGQTQQTIAVTVNGDQAFESNETFFVNLSNPSNATISDKQGVGTIVNDDAQGGIISFSASEYTVFEAAGSVTITVNRSGDTTAAATVDYSTDDTGAPASCGDFNGLASSKCDFTTAVGRLQFAANETQKTFPVLVNRDSYGGEIPFDAFSVKLSNLTGGAVFGTNSTATVKIMESGSPGANAIDDSSIFVRQHYHDFLNREPDAAGLAFWTNEIESCGTNATCREVKRINVSGAFFLSIEFQETGYLVERLYMSAYGVAIADSTFPSAHKLAVPIIRLNEFLADAQEVGQGVIVGQGNWQQTLENNKQAFIAAFVQRQRFTNIYASVGNPAFVDMLNQNAGFPLSPAERNTLVSDLDNNVKTRAQALRTIAEHPNLVSSEFNRAFVLMQFFGYLRRNPDDPQDHDHTGYDFWLTKLNQFGGNFQNAEMVKAFISSDEYRHRFGP